jgi:hypothetical protein
MFVVQCKVYRFTNRKSTNKRASKRKDDQKREPRIKTNKSYSEQMYIASSFSFKDTNQDILRFSKQRQPLGPTRTQELHPVPTNLKQQSGN